MLNFFKKKPPLAPPSDGVRETLFGDMPIDAWIANAAAVEPWSLFADVQRHLKGGNRTGAIELLKTIAGRNGIESRHVLEAWHALRELGIDPPEEIAKTVHGVVVEVGLEQGVDIVAGYADHSARYYNFSGSGVVWEARDTSLDGAIDALISAGQTVAHQIGPWTDARPPAPPNGQARINMLTPSGLHFGQAELAALAGDGLAGPVIAAALSLMQGLIAKTDNG